MGSRRTVRLTCVASLLIGLLAAACSPTETPALTIAPGSAAPTARPSPTPVPVPSPAATAVGITPASDRVVARVEAWNDLGVPGGPGVFVYADGSIVDARYGLPTVRVLGSTGLDWTTAQLRDSGLFTESRTIKFVPPPSGFGMFRVTFDTGSELVSVTASNAADDAESRSLVALAEGLLEPASWVPAARWGPAGPRIYPYLAREARLTSEVVPLPDDAWINAAQTVGRMAWPLDADPTTVGLAVPIPGKPGRAVRCATVSGADEALIRAALSPMNGEVGDDWLEWNWQLWTADRGLLRLTLRPYLPHEAQSCDPDAMPPAPSLATATRPTFADMLLAAMHGVTPSGAATGPRLWVAAHLQDEVGGSGRVSYYADGSVVWENAPAPAVGYGVRRLTAAGLARINALVDDAGLLNASYNENVPDGAKYERLFSFVSADVILNVTDRGVDPRAERIAPALERLVDPLTFLPADAWVGGPDALSPYRPASIRLWTRLERVVGSAPLLPLALLNWPLDGTPQTWGRPDDTMPDKGWRTGTVSTEQALELVRAFQAIFAPPARSWPDRAEYWLSTPDRAEKFVIEMAIVAGDWGP